jgi:hypothetical protein
VRAHGCLLLLFAFSAMSGCRCKRGTTTTGDAGVAAPVVGMLPSVPVEKFVAARTVGANLEIAAVTRDRTVITSVLDSELRPISREVLATEVEATEGTEISWAGELVVVVAKLANTPGAYVLRKGSAPLAVGRDRCATSDGVAWIVRDGSNVIIKHVRANGESASPPIALKTESEAHLACGPDAITLSARDGEHLSIATVAVNQLATPPALQEVEKEGELDDELRDRLILPRAGRSVALVRIGESSVSVRELGDAGLGAWKKVGKLSLREDADLVEAAAAQGRIFFLASEEATGNCKDGDPPRKIVLYDLEAKGDAYSSTARPVIELPCGVEAINVHLHAEPTRATMWWTEPIDTKACTHPGLSASAVVTASSDKPGARRSAIVAEGITRADETRFLAVIRPGGCVPWAAPGSGQLVFAPAPK